MLFTVSAFSRILHFCRTNDFYFLKAYSKCLIFRDLKWGYRFSAFCTFLEQNNVFFKHFQAFWNIPHLCILKGEKITAFNILHILQTHQIFCILKEFSNIAFSAFSSFLKQTTILHFEARYEYRSSAFCTFLEGTDFFPRF